MSLDVALKRFLSGFDRQTIALEETTNVMVDILAELKSIRKAMGAEACKAVVEAKPLKKIKKAKKKETVEGVKEETKEEAKEEVKTISEEELRTKHLVPFAQEYGMAKASKLLKLVCKVDKVGKVKPEQYEALIEALSNYKEE